MSDTVSQLVRLFAELASDLLRPDAPADGGDVRRLGSCFGEASYTAIAGLAASLNSDERCASSTRVLDAALSLMCFSASEVCSARVERLVGTLVSVLSSLTSCSVFRRANEGELEDASAELLTVGSSLSSSDCGVLMRMCADVLDTLEGKFAAGFCHDLLYAVIKAAASSSQYQTKNYDESKDIRCTSKALQKLARFMPHETFYNACDSPLRLHFWNLDPLILKHDISEMLQEVMQRPFICLSKELHDEMHWREIIVCLVTSPTIFIEARALLHSWFLKMGSSCIMDLKIGIVSSLLDVLCRPLWWNITVELALKYPSCYAYFSNKHHKLLSIIIGPLSCKTFLHLVNYLKAEDIPSASAAVTASVACRMTFRSKAAHKMIDSKSTWAMLMEFPSWFYFSAALIFFKCDVEDYLPKVISNEMKSEDIEYVELRQAAAYYLSWILSPLYEADFYIVLEHVCEFSKCFTMKTKADRSSEDMFASSVQPKNNMSRIKKLQIPKEKNLEKSHKGVGDYQSFPIGVVHIQELNDLHIKLSTRTTKDLQPGLKMKKNKKIGPNYLFSRVSLGVLIMYPTYLDANCCHQLLHYAVTGEIIQLKELQEETRVNSQTDNSAALPEVDASQWALHGARLVFGFLDVFHDMSLMLFDSEHTRANCICQIKDKATLYLVRCIRMLLECQNFCTKHRDTMLDLHQRLTNWKLQGRGAFEGDKAFDDVVNDFLGRCQFF